jgi:hypothetical protein
MGPDAPQRSTWLVLPPDIPAHLKCDLGSASPGRCMARSPFLDLSAEVTRRRMRPCRHPRVVQDATQTVSGMKIFSRYNETDSWHPLSAILHRPKRPAVGWSGAAPQRCLGASEVALLKGPVGIDQGGGSAMPQKRFPTGRTSGRMRRSVWVAGDESRHIVRSGDSLALCTIGCGASSRP